MAEPDWDALGRIGDAPEPEDERDALQARVDALRSALERIAAIEVIDGIDGRWCWQWALKDARQIAREALAAVPEGPEPVYEWRAVAGFYCHHARSTESMAYKDAARFKEESPADAHRIYVERRTAPGEWERVEEGTER